jgi:hypothetical protein
MRDAFGPVLFNGPEYAIIRNSFYSMDFMVGNSSKQSETQYNVSILIRINYIQYL